ncbi:MAG: phage portal protein [Proteobacteria bacterium]|nr:phage portal protein [Pseudomonadota bacterium]
MNLFQKLFNLFPKTKANAYEGATTGRRLGRWGLSSAGPNTALSDSLSQLRSRSRDLTRNSPWVASGIRSLASNLIGCGITPRWILDNDTDLKIRIEESWTQWTNEADFDNNYDFYGLQLLVAQTLIQSGEALVRLVPQPYKNKQAIPFRIQLIEPDLLVDDFDKPLENGNRLQMGIELNPQGKKVAYHLYKSHPGESGVHPDTIRINAGEVLQVYRVDRPGQLRGVPWIASVLLKLRELDQYEDAELVRKKTAALFAGFITEAAPDYRINEPEYPELNLEPGMLKRLAPGEHLEFSSPSDVGGSYEVWIKQQLRAVAAGMGITYEQLTGDLRGVNYSSIRAGLIEFRHQMESYQHHIIIHQMCQPIAERWLHYAVLSGVLDIPDYLGNPRKYHRITWQPPGWDWVDPLKDVQAEILAMQHHLNARQDIIAKHGLR